MKILTSTEEEVIVLRLVGPMRSEDQNEFKKVMVEITGKGHNKVALDMSKVDFIDSSCLGILIWSMKNLRQRGGDLKMFSLAPYISEVFTITRLDSCFTVTGTLEEAITDFAKPKEP